MKTIQEKVWDLLKANGGYLSSVELGERLGIDRANVSSNVTQLFRKKLLELRRDKEFDPETAHARTTRRYKAVGDKFVKGPPLRVVPASEISKFVPLVKLAPEALPPRPMADTTQNDYAEFLEYQAFQKFLAMKKQING